MVQGKILVVDDDGDVRKLVATYLEREGFTAEQAASGAAARQRFDDRDIDVILLDVRLPDADGFELLRALRENSRTPVIMLTGKDTTYDRVIGLELGADDYLGKPFELSELRARIRAVMRRAHNAEASDMAALCEVLIFSTFTLDLSGRRLLTAEGAEVPLTSGEFDLLHALAEHPRRPLSRDQLLDLTRSRDWTPFDRSIDVLIGRLRRKLDGPGKGRNLIKTMRSVGYVLTAEVRRRRLPPDQLAS